MIFCKIDKELTNLISLYAKGKTIVDVGCGDGLLHQKMSGKVISIDLLNAANLPFVLEMDACMFDFNEMHFPVIIRPNHGRFVPVFLDTLKRKNRVTDLLYISMPENVNVDIPKKYQINMKEDNRWTGSDGERIYYIVLGKEKIERFILTSWDPSVAPVSENLSWFKVKNNETRLYNWGGGYTPLQPNGLQKFKIVKDVLGTTFYGLDWTGTYLDSRNWKRYRSGWLDRTGKLYACDRYNHDSIAVFLLKKNVHELEDLGWVRIYTSKTFACIKSLSAEQRNWLSLHGFDLEANLR